MYIWLGTGFRYLCYVIIKSEYSVYPLLHAFIIICSDNILNLLSEEHWDLFLPSVMLVVFSE